MRHADIRTTMNINGDVVTDEMPVASGKVTRLALNGLQTDCKPRSILMFWRKRVRVEHTGDRVTRRPTVLKTVAVTGLHALPQLTIHTLAASALGQVSRRVDLGGGNRRLRP